MAIFGRPVNARAALIAAMTASEPEFMKRIFWNAGEREHMCSANSTSTSGAFSVQRLVDNRPIIEQYVV